MKDRRIQQKVIKGLLKRGYQPDKAVLQDIHKTITMESIADKCDPYYIMGLVCDYGFYIGMRETSISLQL